MAQQADWFTSWFNSPYYHILYKNRDAQEAQQFLDLLLQRVPLPLASKVLDVGCGRGQHAVYLSQCGFDVTGIDLAEENIAYAKQFEKENLHFVQHDMREVFKPRAFDLVLSLFTSFGYFKGDHEQLTTLKAMAAALKPGATLVLDFLNMNYVRKHLVAEETKEVDGITFHLTRHEELGFLYKHITFKDQGVTQRFEERIRTMSYEILVEYLHLALLRVSEVFGNYDLSPFHPEESERMIFVLKK